MNIKALNIIKNMSYTITSNLISIIISIVVVLIIPKLIGLEEYGYWQLFLFYSSFAGFFHLGWNDGIYLRYGGEKYNHLNRKLFFSQFSSLLLYQLIFGLCILITSFYFVKDDNRIFVICMIVIAIILTNLKSMLLFILQATNRIKVYAAITLMDRIIFVLLLILLLTIDIRNYKVMIYADLIGKFVALTFAMYACKNIVFNKISDFHFTLKETMINIRVGIKLMIANIANMLIIGISRFGIERTWDVATFGKVSLTLSLSSMLMFFINAVGIVMFPILRRIQSNKLSFIYSTLRDLLMPLLFGILIIYYPLKINMVNWLPQYEDGLMYLAILFPMFLYEGKMALLISTYLKTLRKEKVLLKINIISMMSSFIMTYIATQILKSLDLVVLTIVIALALRSVLAEIYLSKKLKIKLKKDIILELFMTIMFISLGWFIDSWLTLIIYAMAYIVYLLVKVKDIKRSLQNITLLMKN